MSTVNGSDSSEFEIEGINNEGIRWETEWVNNAIENENNSTVKKINHLLDNDNNITHENVAWLVNEYWDITDIIENIESFENIDYNSLFSQALKKGFEIEIINSLVYLLEEIGSEKFMEKIGYLKDEILLELIKFYKPFKCRFNENNQLKYICDDIKHMPNN